MKIALFLFMSIAVSIIGSESSAQSPGEIVIRNLEEAERKAIATGDTTRLKELMSKDILVQNPENNIVGLTQVIDRVRAGKINYASFNRRIDSIAFVNNIAIVMGLETLQPRGESKYPGKTVKRRFTNIWTKENEQWKLTARQASIVNVE